MSDHSNKYLHYVLGVERTLEDAIDIIMHLETKKENRDTIKILMGMYFRLIPVEYIDELPPNKKLWVEKHRKIWVERYREIDK